MKIRFLIVVEAVLFGIAVVGLLLTAIDGVSVIEKDYTRDLPAIQLLSVAIRSQDKFNHDCHDLMVNHASSKADELFVDIEQLESALSFLKSNPIAEIHEIAILNDEYNKSKGELVQFIAALKTGNADETRRLYNGTLEMTLNRLTRKLQLTTEHFAEHQEEELKSSKLKLAFALYSSVVAGIVFAIIAILLFIRTQQTLKARALAETELNNERARHAQNSKITALEEMASGIAHEINNPLAIIMGNSTIVRRFLTDHNLEDPMVLQKVDKIISTAERISKIIKSLRDFTRDTRYDIHEITHLNKLIEDVIGFCQTRFKELSVHVDVQCPSDIQVSCNLVQIQQVILNLLNNSVDAIATSPEKWIRILAQGKGKMVRIRIVDSGQGIPKDIVEKIMQPFFTTKPAGQGTGVGLTVSRRILAAHNSSLEYELFEGNTSFWFALEIAQDKES